MGAPFDALLNQIEWTEIPGRVEMKEGDIPHATHEGVLDLGGSKLRCYQLSNGQRVFDANDIAEFFGITEDKS